MERAKLPQPRVVDENIHGDARALGRIVNLLRRFAIVQVGGNDARLSAARGQLRGQSLKPLLAPRRQNQLCAAAGQLPRQLRADSRSWRRSPAPICR